MPTQNEKEKRKQIKNDLKKKELEEFESSLPLRRSIFNELFDFLDSELGNKVCDNTLRLTEQFLLSKGIADIVIIKNWLGVHSGYCDCEVLANVEGLF